MQDLLSQDEIDALLHGVDDGDINTDSDDEPGSVRAYDLTSQDRIVRGRMPTLEMINERFARYTRISMFNMLRRSADVAVGGVQVMKFGEYVHSLYVPTSLNLVKIKPDVLILIISALSDKATAIEALKKGANGFLCKPFTDRQLTEALEELLRGAGNDD